MDRNATIIIYMYVFRLREHEQPINYIITSSSLKDVDTRTTPEHF
jgi:hypothetical protein